MQWFVKWVFGGMSLYLRNRIWWVCVVDGQGQIIRKTTRTSSKREAKRFHDQLKAELRRKPQPTFNKKQSRLQDAVTLWLEHGKGKATFERDKRVLEFFVSKLSHMNLFLYVLFSYATSLSFKFLWNVREGVDAINLAEFMPGDWVMACESHGYDQRFVVEEFGREYPLVGSADEDAWGVVFISGDGSYVSASGTCFDSGVVLRATVKRCMKREEAVFKRDKRSARTGCAVFTTG